MGKLSRRMRIGPLLAVSTALLVISCGSTAGCNAKKNPIAIEKSSMKGLGAEPSLPGIAKGDALLDTSLASALAQKSHTYKPRTHHLNQDGSPKYTNRLILQTSPYLLQHAHNPVNWRGWGPEAFAAAKRLNRPILLSVGYSTCHWCHVMERESFEDKEIASFINEHFIAIKVDREERPDIDDIYMRAVRLLSGRGGWPMTVLMTPDKDPFFGGTYIPARDGDRGTRQGFFSLLSKMSSEYSKDPSRLLAKAQETSQRIEAASAPQRPGRVPGPQALEQAAVQYIRTLDPIWGGFGRAPKFPRPASLDFLLRYQHGVRSKHASRADAALHAAVFTIEKMSEGGIFDHVGGGFHRYSTDAQWLVPHFEKMLYDNAQLVSAILAAYQITGDERLSVTARRTLDYVIREMRSEEGAFYSATDADSLVPSGHMEEGYFFTWTPQDLNYLLTTSENRAVRSYYGVTDGGNFEGRNILRTLKSSAQVAQELKIPSVELERQLASAREKLYQARSKRTAPGLDDKILTSWNGLMISAFCRGAFVLGDERYAQIAQGAVDYLLPQARARTGDLLRSTKDGQSRQPGFLDDYAFFIAALLDVFEVTHNARYLKEALHLQKRLDTYFWDEDGGAYFKTSTAHEDLLARDKPSYDGAEPSGNSVAADNLLRLANITSDDKYRKRAEGIFAAFSSELTRGSSAPRLLAALHDYLRSPLVILLVHPVDEETSEGEKMQRLVREVYVPEAFVMLLDEGESQQLAASNTIFEGKVALNGKTTAYVCEEGRCELPAKNVATLGAQLQKYGVRLPQSR